MYLFLFLLLPPPPISTLFPYTTLFRSREDHFFRLHQASLLTFFPGLNERSRYNRRKRDLWSVILAVRISLQIVLDARSEEHTSELQSRRDLVCRLLLEKKKHNELTTLP